MKAMKALTCCVVLLCATLALADGVDRTLKTAVMDRQGELLPEAKLIAQSPGSEAVKAEPVGNGTWILSGVGEKTTLHLQHPVHGTATVELQVPAAQAQVAIYWSKDGAEAKIVSTLDSEANELRPFPTVSPSPRVTGGSRQGVTCPPGSLFGQDASTPDDGWVFGIADANGAGSPPNGTLLQRWDDYSVSGEICDLHWWGLRLTPGFGAECFENMAFEITFHPDVGGLPGPAACTYVFNADDIVPAATGVFFVGFEMQEWSVVLDPCCTLQSGWVSITATPIGDADCNFLWASTGNAGDPGTNSLIYDEQIGGDPITALSNGQPFDLAFCLTGEYVPVYGACCDDYTGMCTDNVEQMNCPPPLRFGPNALCDDLFPPCGPTGACCDADGVCLFTDVQAACDAAGGTWYEGEDCGAGFECPEGCDHTITLTDSYGDGWTTFGTPAYHTVDVYVNGNLVLAGLYIENGTGPESHIFMAAGGDTIFCDFTDNGSYDTECGYTVYDGLGMPLGSATGPNDLTVTGNCEACTPPANDDCVTAAPVSGPYPQTVSGTNYCASIDCPGVLDWYATWWEVDLPYAVNNLVVSYCPSGFEITNVGVVYYDDCTDCNAYVLYDSIDWYGCPGGQTSPQIYFDEVPGPTTVFFPVMFNENSPVDYTIEFDVTELVVPENDLCENAIPVAVPSVTAGSTDGATLDTGFPTAAPCVSITAGGVWYSVTGTGNTMMADLCNGATSYDSKMSVFCSDCVDPLCVGGNDDYCGLQSAVEWCSQYGANYLILVHGYSSATGGFELTISDDGVNCCGQADPACLPMAACCLPDGSCEIMDEYCCLAMGGTFHPELENCEGLGGSVVVLSEDFNAGIPAGWTITDDAGAGWQWELNTTTGRINYAGGDGTCMDADADWAYAYPYDTSLITPEIAIPAGAVLEYIAAYNYLGTGEAAEVNISTDGGVSWTNLLTWMEDHDAYGPGEAVSLDLSAYAGSTAHIAFRYYGDSWDWYYEVDNVAIVSYGEAAVGACCLPDGSCVVTIPECCADAGGCYAGNGTDCGGSEVVPIWEEHFEAGIPGDWTVTDDDGSGLVWNTNTYWGDPNWTGGAGVCVEADSDNFGSASYDTSLISPVLDLSGAAGAQLDFDANYQWLSSDEYFEVFVSYDGGGSWTNLLSWNEDHGTFHGTPGEHVTLDLGPVTATTQLRFRYSDPTSSWNWEIQVDEVVIGVIVYGDSPCQSLDIKPGSCPNSYNRKSHGVLPVALVGTDSFDVTMVDLDSITLSRCDGIGGSVAPHEGPPGPHSTYGDAATPFDGVLCDCHELEGDGITDLKMKFKTDEVVPALELNGLDPGSLVMLAVHGTMLDGTPFVAADCVRLVPPGTPPGLVNVMSNVRDAYIEVGPLDSQLDGDGFASFQRTYPLGSLVTLTATSVIPERRFKGWEVNGVMQPGSVPVIQITVSETVSTVNAVYNSLAAPPPLQPNLPPRGVKKP